MTTYIIHTDAYVHYTTKLLGKDVRRAYNWTTRKATKQAVFAEEEVIKHPWDWHPTDDMCLIPGQFRRGDWYVFACTKATLNPENVTYIAVPRNGVERID